MIVAISVETGIAFDALLALPASVLATYVDVLQKGK